jgi:ubiquinone/menaquinone biosynthesis C-methylase UbiE
VNGACRWQAIFDLNAVEDLITMRLDKSVHGISSSRPGPGSSRGTRLRLLLILPGTCAFAALLQAQAPSPGQLAQERAQAEIEIPKLVEVLALKPSMTVADVGAGGGAITVVLAKWLVSGRVLATDINPVFLAEIREYVKQEGLSNVTLVEGTAVSTNLPTSCCDAILMRNVYHHLTEPETFITSVIASLKPDGQLAIVDFPARPGSALPKGVRANRGGNGIPSSLVVQEVRAVGLTHVQTIQNWPTGDKNTVAYLTLFGKP